MMTIDSPSDATSRPGSAVLDAVGSFREAGFALHWLQPRSKKPVASGWSEAPVATLAELRAGHRPGYNLGVRPGEPSALAGGGYLHILDLDIRVPDLAEEAWTAARALFPDVDLDRLPTVLSGAGGESRHLYLISDKPFRSKKLAVSEGKHRSTDGRWRYDWEIELFGTDKQVAMPPSIHPDTGHPYRWLHTFDLDLLALGLGPFVPAAPIERLAVAESAVYEFETRDPLTFEPGQMERDLTDVPLARIDDYHDWVTLGQALHHQFGGSDDGLAVWIEQSRRSEKFDASPQGQREMRAKWRGFGRNRRQPVTMGTVRQWAIDARRERLLDQFDDIDAFDEGPVESEGTSEPADDPLDLLGEPTAAPDDDPLDDIDAIVTATAPGTAGLEWTSLLDIDTDKGAIKNNLHNIALIVRHDPRLAGLAQLNEFTQETVQRTPPGRKSPRRRNPAKPTRQLEGPIWQVRDTVNGDLWSDERDAAVRSVLEAPKTQGGYGIKVSDRDLKSALSLAAREHAFHPVREYLNSVTWDGTPRLETFLIRYLGAADTPYMRSVARLTLLGGVTRIFEPGHKFDFVLILEGVQGKRKSTFIAILGKHWFAELEGNLHDRKSLVEKMLGSWVLELPELQGFNKAEVSDLKAFVTAQKDRVRLAYDRRAKEFARQCIFIGSTNDREYLKDPTGGRRFWPVECTISQIDTVSFAAEVDQLWAEAVVLYREMRRKQPSGTLSLYLSDEEAREVAEKLQESRRQETEVDILAGQIEAWLNKPIDDGGFDDTDAAAEPQLRNETCVAEVWVECLGNEWGKLNRQASLSLASALKAIDGWEAVGSITTAKYGKQRCFYRGGRKARVGI